MLMNHLWDQPHLGRRLSGFLQSPADINARLREEDLSEEDLASEAPELPPRLDGALRDLALTEYLRPTLRHEVDVILHGALPREADDPRRIHGH
jgi:hypothetical protein